MISYFLDISLIINSYQTVHVARELYNQNFELDFVINEAKERYHRLSAIAPRAGTWRIRLFCQQSGQPEKTLYDSSATN